MQSHKVTTPRALLLVTLGTQLITAAAATDEILGPWASNRNERALGGNSGGHHGGRGREHHDHHDRETNSPHGKQDHECHDVSDYGDIEIKHVKVTVCNTTLTKKCIDKHDEVCLDIPLLKCDHKPYTDCKMEQNGGDFPSWDVKKEHYKKWECKPEIWYTEHTKYKSKCENITKPQCTTLWDYNSKGEKVWSGVEECKDITWEDCWLEPYNVTYPVTGSKCFESDVEMPHLVFENTTSWLEINHMTCVPQIAMKCETKTKELCEEIWWQECWDEPDTQCFERWQMEPWQKHQHKKKCIFEDGSIENHLGHTLKPEEIPEHHHKHGDEHAKHNPDSRHGQFGQNSRTRGSTRGLPIRAKANEFRRRGRNSATLSQRMEPPALPEAAPGERTVLEA